MGKGCRRRPRLVSREEYEFRWDYGEGKYPDMNLIEFNKRVDEIRVNQTMRRSNNERV